MAMPFHQRWLESGMRADEFLPLGVGDVQTRVQRAQSAAKKRTDARLLALLGEQNGAHPALTSLTEGGTALVITGQQVGLFLGPLYTLAKAASAIVWAAKLSSESGVRCVPLFWLQTEDHDFAEINHCSVPRASGEAPLRLHIEGDDARIAIAQRRLPESIPLQTLADALHGTPYKDETLALLQAHYRPGARWADAFKGVLQAIFPELLVLDPRCQTLAALAAPVIERALTHAPAIEAGLFARTEALSRAGFAVQIPPRRNTLLPFVHLPDAQGPRHRPALSAASALRRRLHADPLCFSSSALLRPIVQDTLLPTALYVGGPAEIDYFAEASALYTHFDLPQPLVALRARMRILTPRLRAYLDATGLTASDMDADIDTLARRLMGADGDGPQAAWLQALDAHFDAYARSASPALKHRTEKTKRSMHHRLQRLARQHERERFLRNETLQLRLGTLRHWLKPDGNSQERVHAFMAFSARVSLAGLRCALLTLDPLNPRIQDLRP